MNTPPFEVADIIRLHGKSFIERNRSWLGWLHVRVLLAIERCRTAALGGHKDRCCLFAPQSKAAVTVSDIKSPATAGVSLLQQVGCVRSQSRWLQKESQRIAFILAGLGANWNRLHLLSQPDSSTNRFQASTRARRNRRPWKFSGQKAYTLEMLRRTSRNSLTTLFLIAAMASTAAAQVGVPKVWDDDAMATLEVPMADPAGSPKHVSANYYYRIPVRPIYKSYPVYATGREPAGYMDRLQKKEPVVLWDDKGNAPRLTTDADWIKAGAIVFESPLGYTPLPPAALQKTWLEAVRPPVASDGTLPFYRLFIRQKGQVELGADACAMCHTRVMSSGDVVEGAQGNFPFDRSFAFFRIRLAAAMASDKARAQQDLSHFLRVLFAAPWMRPDPQERLFQMSLDQLASVYDAIPPGVNDRHRTSPLYPVQVPDLIGVEQRRYLDRTGLQQHRSIGDLMRYAALNQGADYLASHDGFIPLGGPEFHELPNPEKVGGRYSDTQLYALAKFLYSLAPPRNPNHLDAVALRGREIFNHEGCAGCHTPPLYTNNKLTPVAGFTVPAGAAKRYDIMNVSVGTDPMLATKTRRGTGYYKVPSLKGVWYRSMFGHSGWCATLEDWFDPQRLREDYVPTGFKPPDAATYAVKGHPYGLRLSTLDKTALIAFLNTL
jgi:hypothetical protein